MTQALNISESGRRAFAAGLKPKDNPFHIGSQACSLWAKGFRQAKDAAARTAQLMQPPAPLVVALGSRDLNVTVKTIQTALGITDGDVAGQCFSDDDRKTYAALECAAERAYFIKSWLAAELDDAAAVIDPVDVSKAEFHAFGRPENA